MVAMARSCLFVKKAASVYLICAKNVSQEDLRYRYIFSKMALFFSRAYNTRVTVVSTSETTIALP